MRLSAIERKILNCIQEDIPLEPQPFKLLSKRLGMREDEFLKSLKSLRARGIIRRFAAGLDHRRMGFTSSLIAMRVPSDRIEDIAKDVARHSEVTHCYLREGDYNLWTVFLSLDKNKVARFLNRLTKKVGKRNILNLPTKRQFKLKTALQF